jgi:hypothetical protein
MTKTLIRPAPVIIQFFLLKKGSPLAVTVALTRFKEMKLSDAFFDFCKSRVGKSIRYQTHMQESST